MEKLYLYIIIPPEFCPVWCPILMPLKVIDFINDVNSKYSFTDSKEYKIHKTLLEKFISTKAGQKY